VSVRNGAQFGARFRSDTDHARVLRMPSGQRDPCGVHFRLRNEGDEQQGATWMCAPHSYDRGRPGSPADHPTLQQVLAEGADRRSDKVVEIRGSRGRIDPWRSDAAIDRSPARLGSDDFLLRL
jgi:hypothetical protein